MSAVSSTTAAPPAVRISVRAVARRLALPVLFAASSAYQFLQARAHVTPTVFNDELLYAKLSQAIAAGHGLAIRGEHYAFPSLLAFSLGLAIVPGALLGFAYALARPRSRLERAFAALATATIALFILQAAFVSAGEAHRP